LIYNKKYVEIMRKKPDDTKIFLQVDPLNGEYYIRIPEWMINDLSWYEDTQIKVTLDNDEIILSEYEDE